MTETEKKIINEFYFGRMSRDELLRQYPVDLKKDKKHIYLAVRTAFEHRDSQELSFALALIVFDPSIVNTEEFVELLCLLLREKWHPEHENIATILQAIKSPKSVDALYDAALTEFDSIAYMETYSLARKCIHALGDINTEYSKEKLQLLAQSNIPIIKEKAVKQLNSLNHS